MAAPLEQIRQILKRNRFLKHFLSGGLPFIVLIVGGSFALKQFRVIRYEAIDKRKRVDDDVMDEINAVKKAKKARSLEEEYEIIKQENIDEWSNIRGPRPWENSKEYQESQRANLEKQKQSAAAGR